MHFHLRRVLFLILLSFIFSTSIFSQESQSGNQRAVPFSRYGSVGWSGAWATASGYLEAMINTPGVTNPFFRVGVAAATGFAIGSHVAFEAGLMFGKGNSHVEITGGYHYGFSKWYDFARIGGSVGYRYQKPEGVFIFRTGIGYTEGLYAGIGLRINPN
jgi:hypothetical protein